MSETGLVGKRRRWLKMLAAVVGVVVVALGAATAAVQHGLPWWTGDRDHNHVFDGPAGSLRYQVHLPPQYASGTALPVIMAIHGCGMTGYGFNSMKSMTQFNSLADREGFIVVYPTQRMFQNLLNCWESNDPRQQRRDTGEPALLAGVARRVIDEYNADGDQVHVVGASSGAGTAVILAATHPDLFATATSVAGGEYGLNQVDPGNPNATPPERTARQAWAQMGDRARHVPLLIVQGKRDTVVPPVVATRLFTHWSVVNDLVDDGLLNDSLGWVEEATTVPAVPGTHPYTRTTLTGSDGFAYIDMYLVENMGHAYPSPTGEGLFAEQSGPDASSLAWQFAEKYAARL
ncbi:extracellular catalytic domain type 1 short-chain-length polyhydroxyalkanoate depolymerase [Mycolicibacterium frederiksbergense]|uniref:extracellular catalytic domain type 1 short-chain-length polyhydroxyalkanoate depolymerase n=1 Tax=Mycolicibacterium frederiksbergense TaxID=117567 RepID=UPI00265B9730|nr:PHB depolymerase family esterase [Mycolicibacterium frederiksbergense]MDO0977948.1 PHB depolymerase family esterase [Mycolicibacterium frederiksbergense]